MIWNMKITNSVFEPTKGFAYIQPGTEFNLEESGNLFRNIPTMYEEARAEPPPRQRERHELTEDERQRTRPIEIIWLRRALIGIPAEVVNKAARFIKLAPQNQVAQLDALSQTELWEYINYDGYVTALTIKTFVKYFCIN